MRNIVEWTSFQHDHSHHFNEVGYRIEWGNNLRPSRHTFDWGEQATEQIEDHNEEKWNRHGLLLCGRIGRNEQSSPRIAMRYTDKNVYTNKIFPRGIIPYTTRARMSPMVKTIIPSIQKGISLPKIKWILLIGVTLICSMVPISFLLQYSWRTSYCPPLWREEPIFREP